MPVIVGVSVLTFLLLNLLPGSIALAIAGPGADPQTIKAIEIQDGLTKPLWDRYWQWLWHAVQGNLGRSLTSSESVTSLVAHALPVTLEVIIVAQVVALVLAVPAALAALADRSGRTDRVLGAVAFAGVSAPHFLWGIILILVFSVHFHLLPATGWVPLTHSLGSNLKSAVLPATTLGIGEFSFYMRILRGDMIDQLREEYVTTARAKGLSGSRVLVGHVLRNSLFSLITVVGVNFGKLISGAVIVETLFALPGIGNLLVTSIYQRDVNVVQGVVVLTAVAFVIINLAVDLLYSTIDPRVRYEVANG
ncbi:MAG: ABC transporter permease [Acidobacteriota bacterium]|nr:ABC transporter permease [Acidobacteriota bacterium]